MSYIIFADYYEDDDMYINQSFVITICNDDVHLRNVLFDNNNVSNFILREKDYSTKYMEEDTEKKEAIGEF